MFEPLLVSLCLRTNRARSVFKTDTLQHSYNGDNSGFLGKCWVSVKYHNQEFDKLLLLFAEGQRPSLLGRNWLSKI